MTTSSNPGSVRGPPHPAIPTAPPRVIEPDDGREMCPFDGEQQRRAIAYPSAPGSGSR